MRLSKTNTSRLLDTNFYVYVGLAIWLEKWIADGPGRTSQWFFSDGDSDENNNVRKQDREVLRVKDLIGNYMRQLLAHEDFLMKTAADGNLGTHSF